ncbi:MAG TPA: permease, partial [Gemmataceae bacterium]|nr:permease [Gemmataceae bacterium]
MDTELPKFINSFISILYEALPFIILGAVIAGILEELVPQRIIAKIIPRSRVVAIAIGGLLGLLFPMCECGIIPVMRRLLRKGVPLSCCVCYVLGGPIINVVVMLSTYVAFSGKDKFAAVETGSQLGSQLQGHIATLAFSSDVPFPGHIPWAALNSSFPQFQATPPPPQFSALGMMSLRMGLGFLVAFGTSLIVEWQHRKHGNKLLAPLAIADTAVSETNDDEETPAQTKSWF